MWEEGGGVRPRVNQYSVSSHSTFPRANYVNQREREILTVRLAASCMHYTEHNRMESCVQLMLIQCMCTRMAYGVLYTA